MRKVICLILTVVMAAAFTACGEEKPVESTATPEPVSTEAPLFNEKSESVWDEDTVFATMVSINEETFVASIDGAEHEFYFSQRSLKELSALGIKVGDEIAINYEKAEDGSLTAVSIELMAS